MFVPVAFLVILIPMTVVAIIIQLGRKVTGREEPPTRYLERPCEVAANGVHYFQHWNSSPCTWCGKARWEVTDSIQG